MKEPTAESLIIGIDCATEPRGVGIAIARVSHGRVVIEDVFLGNDAVKLGKRRNKEANRKRLVRYLAERLQQDPTALLALDAPLGWPDAMRCALPQHRAGEQLRPAPERMFRRATDAFVTHQTGKNPLEVGAAWIARTAHAALDLLQEIRAASELEIPLAWSQGPPNTTSAIEVYPALALLALTPERANRKEFGRGYKAKKKRNPKTREVVEDPGSGARQVIWDRLRSLRSGGPFGNSQAPKTEHEIDAVLCVQVGVDFLRSGCAPIPADRPMDVLRREGWIWFSKRAVKEGVAASSRDPQ